MSETDNVDPQLENFILAETQKQRFQVIITPEISGILNKLLKCSR